MLSIESVAPAASNPALPSGKMYAESSASTTTHSDALSRLSRETMRLWNRVSDRHQAKAVITGSGIAKGSSIVRSGRSQVLLLDQKEQSRGLLGTLNIMDWHSDAVVSSLSQVLVKTSIPLRFYWSSIACAGIIHRAAKRGKKLPERLTRALMAVVSQAQTQPAAGMSYPLHDLIG